MCAACNLWTLSLDSLCFESQLTVLFGNIKCKTEQILNCKIKEINYLWQNIAVEVYEANLLIDINFEYSCYQKPCDLLMYCPG